MKKILCCIALAMMFSVNADAQLGGLGKKLKDKATEAVKEKTSKVKSDVKPTTPEVQQEDQPAATQPTTSETKPAATQQANSFEHKVPQPWPMKYKSDINGGPIDQFIKQLDGNLVAGDTAVELRDMMIARYNEDVALSKTRGCPSNLSDQIEGEMDRWETFWFKVNDFFNFYFSGNVGKTLEESSINQCTIRAIDPKKKNFTTYNAKVNTKGKVTFCNANGVATVVIPDEVSEIRSSLVQLQNIYELCKGVDNDDAREAAIKAQLCYDYVLQAIGNNNGDAWDEIPMPKPGPVHSAIHDAAVRVAKAKYPDLNVQDVVGEGNWDVLLDMLRRPVRRVAHAFILIKNDKGELFSIDGWFCQNYNLSKGAYEPLIAYGVNDNRIFRIKK